MSKTGTNPLLDAQKIQEALHLNTKNIMKDIMGEGIQNEMKKYINESPEEEDYEEEEVTPDDFTQEEPLENPAEEVPHEGGEEGLEGGEEVEGVEGGEELDLVDAPDDDLIKIFKKIDNDGQVEIVKTENGLELTDNETGSEYIINIGGSEGDEGDVETVETDEYEISESLGYTNSYQKPVMKTAPKVNASFKGTREWDKGVPDGPNNKLGNKGDGKPFNEGDEMGGGTPPMTESDELNEEETVDENIVRVMNKRYRATVVPDPAVKDMVKKKRTGYAVRNGGSLKTEDRIIQMEAELNKIKTDNQILKESVIQFRNVAEQYYLTARETATTNYKLGKVFRLFTENSTTQDEKKNIIERMDKIKNMEDASTLYETIKTELKNKKPLTENIDKTFASEAPTVKNEKIFVNEAASKTLDLMHRVNGIQIG
jgi:hypothetical protein